MASFNFKNIRVAGIACTVPKNEVKTESYKALFGEEEVNNFFNALSFFNKIKVNVLSGKYKVIIMKKYLNQLNKANNNINAIRLKMDQIKNDVLNLNVNK